MLLVALAAMVPAIATNYVWTVWGLSSFAYAFMILATSCFVRCSLCFESERKGVSGTSEPSKTSEQASRGHYVLPSPSTRTIYALIAAIVGLLLALVYLGAPSSVASVGMVLGFLVFSYLCYTLSMVIMCAFSLVL